VPRRQPAHHEQPEPVRVGQREVRRAGQLLVDLGEQVGLHAEAAVFHLDDEPVGHPLGPDLDPGAGRGEHGRVLDQFGQQVDHVRDRRAGHRVLAPGDHPDPLIVLDLADRAADNVNDRHRVAPRPAG
jgi:hypothetical protein